MRRDYPRGSSAISNRRPLSQRVGRYPQPSAVIPTSRDPGPSAASTASRMLSRTVGRYPQSSAASLSDCSTSRVSISSTSQTFCGWMEGLKLKNRPRLLWLTRNDTYLKQIQSGVRRMSQERALPQTKDYPPLSRFLKSPSSYAVGETHTIACSPSVHIEINN